MAAAIPAQVPPPTPLELAAWPTDWAVSRYAPVVDGQGIPQPRTVTASGWADLDRDGNRDVWFLTDVGSGRSQMHAVMANTANLGRFWPWGSFATSSDRDAATYHSVGAIDMVLGVDPAANSIALYFFSPNYGGGDPRLNGTFGRNPGWPVPLGCFAIATANHDRDAHDDLVLLRDVGGGSTEVRFVHMNNPFGGLPSPQGEAVVTLPAQLDRMRALDLNGDRATDVAVHAPGLGVFTLLRDGKTFKVFDHVPLSVNARDLFVGDIDSDGADELGIVLDSGVLFIDGSARRTALPAPAGVGPLQHARLVDMDNDGRLDVVASLPSADSLLVVRRAPVGFHAGMLHQPAVTVPPGAGALGQSLLAFDCDRDGDEDLAVQVRDGSFVTLRSPTRSLAPVTATVVHEGRFSESFISERLDIALPQSWQGLGFDGFEVGIYMRHPTAAGRPWVLWAHAVTPLGGAIPPAVSVRLIYLVDLSKLFLLTSANLYPQGYAVSGDTMLTVHAKRGQQRYESLLIYHEGRGDVNKSTLGVQWKMVVAPPLPRTDAQLLPF